MTEDLWAIEKQVTKIFQQTIDKVGFWVADKAFEEAGLFEDQTDERKLDRAMEVALELGIKIGED